MLLVVPAMERLENAFVREVVLPHISFAVVGMCWVFFRVEFFSVMLFCGVYVHLPMKFI